MGSVGFDGEDESQPSTSNGKKYKSHRTLLDDCGAVNNASVPRKLRSAIKKRGRDSITSTLRISRKQHHVSNGVETLRKDGAKKSKLNRNKGHITKDEKEVAETLYALADMFSDANKATDDQPPETKSSAVLEAGSSMNRVEDTRTLTLQEESTKVSSKVTLGAACHSSSLVDSTAEVVKFQSLGDAQQSDLPSSNQPAVASASGVQSDISLGPRPMASTLDMTPSGEQAIDLEQVTATASQYGKNYDPMDDKNNGLFLSRSLSATGALISETQGSCFDSTNLASQPHVIENSITAEKYTQVAVESKKSWKRCSAHVYISRLIKVLQVSDRKEGLMEKSTQLTTCEGAELSTQNQMTRINGRNVSTSFDRITHSAAGKDSAEMSTKKGHDFLSLGSGSCDLDAGEGFNRAGCSHEALKQFHTSYMQSQNHSAMLFSLSQNGSFTFHGRNLALAAQQAQLPQYHSSNYMARTGQQLELQQQKWGLQLPTQYNTVGRDSSSMLNYAHTLFPHLHAALGSKYQQFSPPQYQVMSVNSSLPLSSTKLHQRQLERNGNAFYPENIQHLELPCNQRL